ncbi:3-oxo-5-alpha-steroid 4-dehydrogenase-domain-containing protein [Cytidiella melzeri]|nr:3-oxo-5-alpha-steroid 4-dehydrogenase-domain-containing protein [Cytidiella melzeri]
MVRVTVSSPRGTPLAPGLPYVVEIPSKTPVTATIADVKNAFASKYPKFYTSRQKLSTKADKKGLSDETTLATAGVTDGGELVVKDLGPQISWTTVFVIEYIGPLIVHPLMYYLPAIFYGGPVQHSMLQKFVYAQVMLHFLKREFETLFVHRFSHGTMPFAYIFRNSFHYHVFGGVLLAYAIYSPTYGISSPYIQGTIRDDPRFLWACTAVWLWAELSNGLTHLTLRNLRPAGTKQRAIPYGYGFNLVSCPNYTFEIIGWTVMSIMTGSYAAWFFLFAGSYFMWMWAVKKHRNYRKEFGDRYPKRNVIIPFIY